MSNDTPNSQSILDALAEVRDAESFIQRLLAETLDWKIPVDAEEPEDFSYEWVAKDLRAPELHEKLVDGTVRQIVLPECPWGVFLLNFNSPDVFTKGRGMTGPLRQVLRGLSPKLRAKAAHLPSFDRRNLLFICTHDYRHFRFAHFKTPPEDSGGAGGSATPPLAMFGWNEGDQDLRTLCEMNLPALAWGRDWAEAFNVEKVTKQFFEDYKRDFERAEASIRDANPGLSADDLRMFTQTLFNRLMFLRFIERKGWLTFNGRSDYLQALHEAGGIDGESLYRSRLCPLFFTALARKKDDRPADTAERVGDVPFLNGGLFEKKTLDDSVKDIPDAVFAPILAPADQSGLFYKYHFTIAESTPLDIEVAVDPEMLGKVFEELVTGRHESGSYYTPRPVVAFMCREALKGYLGTQHAALIDDGNTNGISVAQARDLLKKLADLTVCDPACGSGAYLLGMLQELIRLTDKLTTSAKESTPEDEYQTKLRIISRNLFGTDKDAFATNIAMLRLWLTLAVEYEGEKPEPLPNLTFKIETGDAIEGPALVEEGEGTMFLQARAETLATLKDEYLNEPKAHDKKNYLEKIRKEEAAIAKALEATHGPDIIDWRIHFAEVLADGGFDIVIANPPYGVKCSDALRTRYFPQFRRGNSTERLPKQSKESYGLFMARGLQLLKPDGHFTFIVSDTWRTIKSHWRLRDRLLRDTAVAHVLDLPPWIFDATVNTCILTLTKSKPDENHQLIAGDLRGIEKGDWQRLTENLTAVAGRGPDAQTATYARYTYPQSLIATYDNLSFFIASPKLYRLMSDNRFVKLGDIADAVHGMSTGANNKYIRKEASARGPYENIEEAMKIPERERQKLSKEEKLGGINRPWQQLKHCFIPLEKGGSSYARGGWLPNYNVPTQYYINWSHEAIEDMRNNPGFRWINVRYFFRPGITFSVSGAYAPTFRLNSQGGFEAKGSGIFSDKIDHAVLLAFLCSIVARYQFKSFVKHSVDTSGDDIAEFRLPVPSETDALALKKLVDSIVSQQTDHQQYPYHLYEQKEIDALVYDLYGLNEQDIREVELWFCRRYRALARAQGVWDEVHEKYADHLARCEKILSRPPSHWASHPILELIARGEGQTLEFKQTLHADNQTGTKHKGVLHSALKTIAALLNTNDGTLLIGATDAGEITGLDPDLALTKEPTHDAFELKLRDLLKDRFSPSPFRQCDITFETQSDGAVCRIDVKATDTNVVTRLDGDEVFIRDGNRTVQLKGDQLSDWKSQR